MFVAVGFESIMTSPDGIHWAQRLSGQRYQLYDVTFGNGVFVAVGQDNSQGVPLVLISADGVSWAVSPYRDEQLASVEYGGGVFTAVGSCGTIITSADGIIWTRWTLGFTAHLNKAAFGSGRFVSVGSGGAIFTSPEGTSWTQRVSGTSKDLAAITYAKDIFVAAGAEGTLLTSADGIDWTARSSGTTSDLLTVAYGNGVFIAAGTGVILRSADGSTWTITALNDKFNDTYILSGAAWDGQKFVVVGNYLRSLGGVLFTSADGTDWSSRNLDAAGVVFTSGIAYGDGFSVIVGLTGMAVSRDLITWVVPSFDISPAPVSGTDITYANGTFVAIGNRVFISHDATTWTTKVLPRTVWRGIAAGPSTFVGVGPGGAVIQSDPVQ
jgi:hypothetical protein